MVTQVLISHFYTKISSKVIIILAGITEEWHMLEIIL